METLPLLLALLVAAVPAALAHEPMGMPKLHCENLSERGVHDYGPGAGGLYLGTDGSVDDCGAGPGGLDGHPEFGLGGALLAVDGGANVPSGDPAIGAGSRHCLRQEGHHAPFGPVAVVDAHLGSGVAFWVGVDAADPRGAGEGCGDGEIDHAVAFLASECPCLVDFPPGLDGAYAVLVDGRQGHVTWA